MRFWLQDLWLNENPCSVMQRGLCSAAIKMDDLVGKRHEQSQVELLALICHVEILVSLGLISHLAEIHQHFTGSDSKCSGGR